jgi:hypothetical protein
MSNITGYKTSLEDGSTANALQISATLIHSYKVRGMIMHMSPAHKLSRRVQNISTTKPLQQMNMKSCKNSE